MSIRNEVKNIAVLLRIYGALFLHIFTQKMFSWKNSWLC